MFSFMTAPFRSLKLVSKGGCRVANHGPIGDSWPIAFLDHARGHRVIDAFGDLIHSTGTSYNNHLYSGEQFDPDLNLYYNRAPYLNVSTGRFWNMDASPRRLDFGWCNGGISPIIPPC
jgi:RHS repeat-associated protein